MASRSTEKYEILLIQYKKYLSGWQKIGSSSTKMFYFETIVEKILLWFDENDTNILWPHTSPSESNNPIMQTLAGPELNNSRRRKNWVVKN